MRKSVRTLFIQGIIMGAMATILVPQVSAIEDLKIKVQGSNVVLHWPSVSGENYIVQHRPTLDTNTPWVTLTNSLPAAVSTNRTLFIHSNIVQFPGCGSGSALLGGGLPGLFSESTGTGLEELYFATPWFDRWQFEERKPFAWEVEKRPPYPWEAQAVNNFASQNFSMLNSPESLSGSCPPDTGFYRVVRDGVHVVGLTNLTNATLSGTVNLTFEAGNAAGILDNAVVLADGVKFAGAKVLSAPITSPWQFEMDTAFFANGVHNLQIEVTWQNPDDTDGNHAFISRLSDVFTVTVTNSIYYPQWEPEVGEASVSAYFLKTTSLNADWQIAIYDVSNHLVKTLSGHTTDGTIAAYWNMVDVNGIGRTNAVVDPEFSSIVSVSGTGFVAAAASATPPKRQRKRDWPAQGRWVICYQDFFKFQYSEDNDMQNSINAFAFTADKYGGYYLYYPPPGSTNDIGQTYPLRYQKANHPDTNITSLALAKDAILLETYLFQTNSRNFYYNGHGSKSSIANISSATLGAIIKHRYRFVFLDGCETAKGDLDAAFGIHGPGRYPLSYYQSGGHRPAAFVGYDVSPFYALPGQVVRNGITYDNEIPWQVPYFITNFLFYWDDDLVGEGLSDAIFDARSILPTVQGFPTQPGEHLQIYGYDALRIDQFNHRTDWP